MADAKNSQIGPFSSTYIMSKTFKIGLVLVVLYFVSLYSYLLFHSLVEFLVATVSVSIFLLAWNSRKFAENSFYIFIGSAFLISGMLGILHVLAYAGASSVPGISNDTNLSQQLRIASQYVLAISLAMAPFFANRKLKPSTTLFFFSVFLALILFSIFWWKNFPPMYIEGFGITAFKRYSEYFSAFLFLLSAYFFYRNKSQFDSIVVKVFYLISILFFISTIFFSLTTSVGAYDFFNMWGHMLKLTALYPVYLGIVEFGLMKPYTYLFGNLKDREESLKKNEKMLRAVVEDQTELVCRFLPDGTLTFVNDAYCRYYGMSRGYLVGKKYFGHIPEDVAEEDKKHLSNFTPENPVAEIEHRAIDKNGWHRWQRWTTRAIFDSKNDLIEYQSVGRDITEQKFTEESLRKSEEKFRALVDNSLVGVYRASLDGNYLYINESMAKMFEFDSAEEMIRENAKIRYEKTEDRENFLKKLRTEGRITNYELTGLTNSGKKIHLLSSAVLSGNEISGMLVNITRRKQAERALLNAKEEWEKTFDSISDPIFILDVNHTIVKANKALLDMFEKSEEEIIGKKCYEVVHKMHQPWVTCPLTVTRKSRKAYTEEVDDPSLGKVLLVTTSPIFDNRENIVGIAHVAKDITERKKMEKTKDEFISLASHQLKTPLSSIALSSELLLRGVAGETDSGHREYLEEIFKATKRMTLLVNNLLNVSRVEMGNFEVNLALFDISSAVSSVVREFSPLASDKKLDIEVNIERNIPVVKLDERSFGIIFENIFSNAIRYTPSGGNISVGLKNTEKGALLEVSDTGCGIPQKQTKKIFRKSFRADNAKEISSEGAGLGLYMARIAAERSGAKIWFESEEGKGTKFFVLFTR